MKSTLSKIVHEKLQLFSIAHNLELVKIHSWYDRFSDKVLRTKQISKRIFFKKKSQITHTQSKKLSLRLSLENENSACRKTHGKHAARDLSTHPKDNRALKERMQLNSEEASAR